MIAFLSRGRRGHTNDVFGDVGRRRFWIVSDDEPHVCLMSFWMVRIKDGVRQQVKISFAVYLCMKRAEEYREIRS